MLSSTTCPETIGESRNAGKSFLLISFFFLLIAQTVFAQWYQQNSGTANILYGVSFTDANNGTAVGMDGTILRTTDGGQNWISQSSGTTRYLLGVSFTDAINGTAVGNDGTILRTTNGGTTWISQLSGTNSSLNGVSFTDANNGTTVGNAGTILRTTNGGTTWSSQSSGTSNPLLSVSFTNVINGTAVGTDGTILRTTNGGTTWIQQSSGTIYDLYGVSFTDANNGTAVGVYGTIIRTTTGGTTWSSQSSGTTDPLYNVSLTDANNGTIVGGRSPNSGLRILRTTDGGSSWIEQSSGTYFLFFGVSFTDANNGWAVGENGVIIHTTNGGVVPIELTSFTATANGKEVILNWSTATELNNQGFEVQRKFGGNDFVTIGSVRGHGTTTSPNNYTFVDKLLASGKYFYRLKQIDFGGKYEYSQIVEVNWSPFSTYKLEQNYPNPFNPTTTIGFGIPEKGNVKLSLLNILGEEIAVLVNEEQDKGYHKVDYNAANLPSGVYFYQLKAGEFIQTRKMILMK